MMMKFLLFTSILASATAFSAVAPKSDAAAIDRSMKDVDGSSMAFDPTDGEAPALQRNNNDEVWVSQVRPSCN